MPRVLGRTLALTLAAASLTACGNASEEAGPMDWRVEQQASGVTSSLRGLSVVSDEIVWVGAPDGQVLRTVDGGANWEVHPVELAAGADLRSAQGFSADHALFITAGQPARILETRDGGSQFRTVWEDATGSAFFDSLAFWDMDRGLAFSDPVDGAFLVLRTQDGGQSWQALDGLPEPLEGEAGFAASNSSIALSEDGCAFIGTGGGARARILTSCDFGESWIALDTPLAAGSGGSGVFAVTLDAAGRLAISGGDYQQADNPDGNFAWSDDHGETWSVGPAPPRGYRSDIASAGGDRWITVGTSGVDIAGPDFDWEALAWPVAAPNAIAFSPTGETGWIIGAGGEIWRLSREQ